ncbi:MAG: hypothetical protein EBT92_17885 [Planctomycetes bacterium]|nr:hypothetical protein [Planctomycetota bacterium]
MVADEETEVFRSILTNKLRAEETDPKITELQNDLVGVESTNLFYAVPIRMDITQNNHCADSISQLRFKVNQF